MTFEKDAMYTQPPTKMIVVVTAGWVYSGDVTVTPAFVTIKNAKNIRAWGTTAGLGQLALNGAQPSTILDEYGTVTVPMGSVVSMMNCKPGALE